MQGKYLNFILTMIAVSLAAIAIQNGIGTANALGDACGQRMTDPCYVASTIGGLSVSVDNQPVFVRVSP